MTLDPKRASLMGRIGQSRRWAKHVTPEARAQQTQAARDAQWQAWLERARVMTGGADLTPEQLHERALRMRRAFFQAMALRREDRRRARAAA